MLKIADFLLKAIFKCLGFVLLYFNIESEYVWKVNYMFFNMSD